MRPVAGVVVAAACLAAACATTATPSPSGSVPTTVGTAAAPTQTISSSTAEAGTSPDAAKQLAALVVAPRVTPAAASYSRVAFGASWDDTDGNGCNQRDDVLLRDAVPGTAITVPQGRCDHDVVAGTWVDPYTGRTLVFDDLKDRSQSQAVQIDHVVPLAEAWVSGAQAWSDDRRRLFANDLDGLLAVDGPANAGKGADDPGAWRPRKPYQCEYAARWVASKVRWALSVDPSEKAALTEMLGFCA